MKKFMLSFVVVLFIILLSFSNSKADWIDKGQYFEMDSTYGEIKDFKISEDGQIWAVNAQNEILNIDFETGKLNKKCSCEVENVVFSSVSEDMMTVVFATSISKGSYLQVNGNQSDLIIFRVDNCQKINNNNLNLHDFKFFCEEFGIEKMNYTFNTNIIELSLIYQSFYPDGKYIITNYNGYKLGFKFNDLKNYISIIHNTGIKKKKFETNIEYIFGFNFHLGEDNQDYINYLQKINSSIAKFSLIKDSISYLAISNKDGTNKQDHFNINISDFKLIDTTFYLSYIFKDQAYVTEYFERQHIFGKSINLGNAKQIISDDSSDNFYVIKDYNNNIALNLNKSNGFFHQINTPSNITKFDFFNIKSNRSFTFYSSDNKLRYFNSKDYITNPNLGIYTFDTLIRVDSLVSLYATFSQKGNKYIWEVEPNKFIESDTNILNYKYSKAGVYDIKLTVLDSMGKEYKYEKLKYITVVSNIKADFSFKFDNEFKDNCYFQSKAQGKPSFSEWDFGDGVKSNEENPVHKYINYGNFKVRFIVGDSISKDTSYQNLSHYNNYSFNDISNRILLKNLTGMPKKTQAVEVFEDSLTFLQINVYKEKWWLNFRDYEYEFYFLFTLFNVDYNLNYLHNSNFPTTMYDNFFFVKVLPNETDYLHFYDFLVLNKSFFNYKYNTNTVNGNEMNKEVYNFKIKTKEQFKMFKYNEQFYYANYFVDSALTIDLKQIRKNALFKKQIKFDKKIINSYSMKFGQKHLALVSFDDFSHKYFIYNDLDTVFNIKELNINKNIKVENIIQFDSENILIYGAEIFPEGNSIGIIIKLNTTTNNLDINSYRACYKIKSIEKISDISYLVLPEVYGAKGYMILDKDLKIKLDNRDTNIPKPIEFLRYIKNHVYMIYQIPDSKNSLNGAYEDNYTTYIVMDTLSDDITGIKTQEIHSNNSLIFPNPSSEKISLDLGGVAVADLVVYDILGNEIMSFPNYTNKSEIDISTLSIGTYTIQIQTNTGSISQRLLVNR